MDKVLIYSCKASIGGFQDTRIHNHNIHKDNMGYKSFDPSNNKDNHKDNHNHKENHNHKDNHNQNILDKSQ